jgi:outer membrane receptor protein involved in Fe transport
MKKIILFCAALAGGVAAAAGQTITGRVCDSAATPLQGAGVHCPETSAGVVTAADGSFSLTPGSGARSLVVSFVGYVSDTLAIAAIGNGHAEIALRPADTAIEGVVVSGTAPGMLSPSLATQKTDMITKTGLLKMACCTLAESFENSATVTVGFTDAVSGAKQVQLLGLAGVYSQMMAENIPTMRGLASTYGWNYTPGQWLEAIHISKGASSVTNGYESVSGQINLEYKKPEQTEDLFINLFGSDDRMFEGNVTAATRVGRKNLSTGLMLHGAVEDWAHDHNHDGFMDMPRRRIVNAYNRWSYYSDNGRMESRTGVRFLDEERMGGQMAGHAAHGGEPYRTDITNRNLTVENKTGFAVGRREGQSVGIITSFTNHEQHSAFGLKRFGGTQNSFYANVLLSSSLDRDGRHAYTAGASFAHDAYRTAYEDRSELTLTPATRLDRRESVAGAFAQYTLTAGDRFTLIAGARGDYNDPYGWLFTPRANVRYAPARAVVLRASAGRGFRSANVIAENIGLMASSRRFDVGSIASLDIERAWNLGGNTTFYIPIWSGRTATLSLDWFHTRFQNQAVVDMERDPSQVFFYNLDGRSTADVWQADLNLQPLEGFELMAALRYNDTRITYSDGGRRHTVEKPLMSRYRGLVNLSYATRFRKWVFDATVQVNGPARLPSLGGYDALAEYSPVFPVWFAQATRNTKRFDVYVGVENIFDFTQHAPIIGADDPFGEGFDSSRVWGPITGRRIYAGIRLRIGNF